MLKSQDKINKNFHARVLNSIDNREFATPVLYMRAKDGTIFEN